MKQKSLEQFHAEMTADGWSLFDAVITDPLLSELRIALDKATRSCAEIQRGNGLSNTDGTSHHILTFEGAFLRMLEQFYLDREIQHYFQSRYILNSIGGVITNKSSSSYAMNAHRDVRTFTGDCKLILNMIVLLDDFTLENGATYLLPGSHKASARPSDDEFRRLSDRLIGNVGSIALFDSNLWHAAGRNQTDQARRAITVTFSKALVKPQFDYVSFFGDARMQSMGPRLRQLLGWESRIPRSLEQWYQPVESRLYLPGQD